LRPGRHRAREAADAPDAVLPVQPGNVGNSGPKEQLGRMFLREQANPSQAPAPDTFISK
jgi:hypothetical protein